MVVYFILISFKKYVDMAVKQKNMSNEKSILVT